MPESTSLHQGYFSNSLTYVYKSEIGQRTKYAALTGTTVMSTANSNLTGSGTLYTVLTAGATNGTRIKTITIKGATTLTRGMVRLYIVDTAGNPNTDIVAEIEIPAVSQNGIQGSFAISLEVDFFLEYNYTLKASIENGSEDTVVIAEGVDMSYP